MLFLTPFDLFYRAATERVLLREATSQEKPRNSMNVLIQVESNTEMCLDQSLETKRRPC